MDRFAAMQTFVRVAEAGSFTAVADQLNLARSAVTRQIAALEQHLGVQLIARSTRRISLTGEGTSYLAQCRDILDRVAEAESALGDNRTSARGLIRATVPMSFGLHHLIPIITEFSAEHPDIGIEIDFSDRRVDLIEEGFDLGIRIARDLPDTQVVRKLSHSRFVVAAAPGYLARYQEPGHPGELVNHQCLGYSLATRSSWPFEIDGELRRIDVSSRFTANNGDALQEAAIRGLGIVYQPTFLSARALRDGLLKPILCKYSLPTLDIYAVFPGNRFVPQRVRTFVDYLAERIGPVPYWDQELRSTIM
jgi:DNA-binding transcriptional LysR family regulator